MIDKSVVTVEARALWDHLGSIGVDIGLTWGGDFTTLEDRPLFEWSGGLSLAQLRAGRARPSPIPTQKERPHEDQIWQAAAEDCARSLHGSQ